MTIPEDAEQLLKSVGLDEVAEIYRSEILIDDYLMRQNNPNDRWDSRRFLIVFAQRIRNAALEEAANVVDMRGGCDNYIDISNNIRALRW